MLENKSFPNTEASIVEMKTQIENIKKELLDNFTL